MRIFEVLTRHAKKYPKMQPEDAVKLIYQATFGGGHMIPDEARATAYIKREHASIPHGGEPWRVESLGKATRVYLDADYTDAELDAIAKLFVLSAENFCIGYKEADAKTKRCFRYRLSVLKRLCADGGFGFDVNTLENCVKHLKSLGYPPTHHSEEYRAAYRPAYRVIDSKYVPHIQEIRKAVLSGENIAEILKSK